MKGKLLLLFCGTFWLTACSHQGLTHQHLTAPDQHQIKLAPDSQLYSRTNFQQATAALSDTLAPEKLLTYLRAYSYFGNPDQLNAADYRQLAAALQALSHSRLFLDSHGSQEQLAVVSYRFFADKERGDELAPLLPILINQLRQVAQQESSLAGDYALWETLRAFGLLLNEARKQPDSSLAKVLLQAKVDQALLDFAASTESLRQDEDWPRMNAYWALGQYRLLLPSDPEGKATTEELQLDAAVAKIAMADVAKRGDAARDAYTLGYHVNRFGGRQACLDNASLCRIPDQQTVLPQRHNCSPRLYVLAQDLSQEEFELSCQRLISQEGDFHDLLTTAHSPTANDGNDSLQVVAFKNWSQYNAYGQLLFDISTDNGGMYIEGTPSKPGNQASFFAFRQWWIAPEFAVWNLNHEYVHYLDGRYVKYGDFGHFPEKLVWWSEGLAEYISKGADNAEAETLASDMANKAPSLAEIFATRYSDGLERTYKWSYLAIRFLAEQQPQALVQLSQWLKRDYFGGYEELLAQIATEQQEAFTLWLGALRPQTEEEAPVSYPRKQNRYAYRDYLRPAHLIQDEQHFHY
ncbi:collagenase [Shewanella cyperi]|uniref:collagenase n=1 Tax=Shewanella cyperi TaxID=2814292 RepID=UPI001A940AD1|nr:collagenase [Shewanella cyperi]QSX40912.1 collagenase [Shewanella cyperi]